jgi:hypothetical protein
MACECCVLEASQKWSEEGIQIKRAEADKMPEAVKFLTRMRKCKTKFDAEKYGGSTLQQPLGAAGYSWQLTDMDAYTYESRFLPSCMLFAETPEGNVVGCIGVGAAVWNPKTREVLPPSEGEDMVRRLWTSPLRPVTLLEGRRVSLCGLSAKPELNECRGTAMSFDVASGRYAVKVDGKASMLLKPCNLSRLDSEDSDRQEHPPPTLGDGWQILALVSHLAVQPEIRRSGLAQELCMRCDQIASSWAVLTERMLLTQVAEENMAARWLCAKLGFREAFRTIQLPEFCVDCGTGDGSRLMTLFKQRFGPVRWRLMAPAPPP